jgi:hypothetical protein
VAGAVEQILLDAWRCEIADAPPPLRARARHRPRPAPGPPGAAIEDASDLTAAQRFAAHVIVEFPAVFAFLSDPRVNPTNWRAEHAFRPAVVQRKSVVAIGRLRAPRRNKR